MCPGCPPDRAAYDSYGIVPEPHSEGIPSLERRPWPPVIARCPVMLREPSVAIRHLPVRAVDNKTQSVRTNALHCCACPFFCYARLLRNLATASSSLLPITAVAAALTSSLAFATA